MQTQFFSCDFECKSEERQSPDVAAFVGIASTAETDLHGDIIEAGAFEPIATKTAPSGEVIPNVLMLRDHDRSQVIGGWRSFSQQGNRLLVEGELALEVAKARETYALMRRGYLGGLSVGFDVRDRNKDISFDRSDGRRRIKKAILRECSIVAFPANTSAQIVQVKYDETEKDVDAWLATYGYAGDDLKRLLDRAKERAAADDYSAVLRKRRRPVTARGAGRVEKELRALLAQVQRSVQQ